MSKGVLSTTADIVNGIWSIGSEVCHTVSDEISDAIDEETLHRTRKHFRGEKVDEKSPAFQKRFQVERKAVAREFKSVAVKGGLIALGLGWFL